MKEKLKRLLQNLNPKECEMCHGNAVVICKTHEDKTVYLCSNHLRGFRFRETENFKSILPYGDY